MGVAVLYTAGSRSLSILENLVHFEGRILREFDLQLLTIEIPHGSPYETLTPANLVEHWRDGGSSELLKEAGATFVRRGAALLLRVPSVIVPEEHNYLVNPAHPLAPEVRIVEQRPLIIDPRLRKVE